MTAAEVGVGCEGTAEAITEGRMPCLRPEAESIPCGGGGEMGNGYDGEQLFLIDINSTDILQDCGSSSNCTLNDTPSNALTFNDCHNSD